MTKMRFLVLISSSLMALALGCGSSKSSGGGGGGAGSGSGSSGGSTLAKTIAMCSMQMATGSSMSMCTGIDQYSACTQSKCGLDACLNGDCKDLASCSMNAADPCNSMCTPSAACQTCLTNVGMCAASMCIDKLMCGTRTKGGPCDMLDTCCASMSSNPICANVKLLEAGGDTACMSAMSLVCGGGAAGASGH